ncbi:conserved hypothetical protein [Thioalkalivibrio sulfidiphilus HL-EbGr7]|uniref:PD-(D/E)XK endonuclease-like domain-containing protein n=1 Tax=Thioalkalivibrio sulfidiphilus (strain HL-EbGR7) TaxID=396588 RepID=B8GSE7_THISH|nr:PD-(D/E)XK nuclease family protein [Thioalkalivibrio sulfidiphilus]ACL72851.1 conserved hypothetical protein [Thioalkalivibrio sulfidiphilus HL-EbGr7]
MDLSRTAIEQYLRCPQCFYMERRRGVKSLKMVPLTLAVATDALLKNEFDAVRPTGAMHPLWEREGLNVRACNHEQMDSWRSNRHGVRVQRSDGAVVFGAVDDIWEDRETGELHVVDYKSTSKKGVPDIDSGFGDSYKRQAEIYQWLLRQSGFTISPVAYFLYVNGSKEGGFYDEGLQGRMRFETTLIPYEGDDSWVGQAVDEAIECLEQDLVPDAGSECDVCRYLRERTNAVLT